MKTKNSRIQVFVSSAFLSLFTSKHFLSSLFITPLALNALPVVFFPNAPPTKVLHHQIEHVPSMSSTSWVPTDSADSFDCWWRRQPKIWYSFMRCNFSCLNSNLTSFTNIITNTVLFCSSPVLLFCHLLLKFFLNIFTPSKKIPSWCVTNSIAKLLPSSTGSQVQLWPPPPPQADNHHNHHKIMTTTTTTTTAHDHHNCWLWLFLDKAPDHHCLWSSIAHGQWDECFCCSCFLQVSYSCLVPCLLLKLNSSDSVFPAHSQSNLIHCS